VGLLEALAHLVTSTPAGSSLASKILKNAYGYKSVTVLEMLRTTEYYQHCTSLLNLQKSFIRFARMNARIEGSKLLKYCAYLNTLNVSTSSKRHIDQIRIQRRFSTLFNLCSLLTCVEYIGTPKYAKIILNKHMFRMEKLMISKILIPDNTFPAELPTEENYLLYKSTLHGRINADTVLFLIDFHVTYNTHARLLDIIEQRLSAANVVGLCEVPTNDLAFLSFLDTQLYIKKYAQSKNLIVKRLHYSIFFKRKKYKKRLRHRVRFWNLQDAYFSASIAGNVIAYTQHMSLVAKGRLSSKNVARKKKQWSRLNSVCLTTLAAQTKSSVFSFNTAYGTHGVKIVTQFKKPIVQNVFQHPLVKKKKENLNV
jgi:hypothetical protein